MSKTTPPPFTVHHLARFTPDKPTPAESDTRHTPEPWKFSLNDDLPYRSPEVLARRGAACVAGKLGEGPEAEANTVRIVACVNACAGMADPAATIAALRGALAFALEYAASPAFIAFHGNPLERKIRAALAGKGGAK